jgi:hypothetical protein
MDCSFVNLQDIVFISVFSVTSVISVAGCLFPVLLPIANRLSPMAFCFCLPPVFVSFFAQATAVQVFEGLSMQFMISRSHHSGQQSVRSKK